MFAFEIRQAIEAAPRDRLPQLSAALWKAFGAGAVTEAQAEELSLLIEARKAVGSAQSPAGGLRQLGSTFPARKPQRPPVRSVAIERRRRWAAAGRMPPKIADKFTPGEQAALAVVAFEVTKRGSCTLAIGAIAALAGVSESTVKRAQGQAKRLGLIKVEERRLSRFRNDTNVVRVISREWLSWLRLGPKGGGVQRWTGTNTGDINKRRQRPSDREKRAIEKVRGATGEANRRFVGGRGGD